MYVTGVDSFGNSMLLAECIMSEETKDSYQWFLEQLQQAVGADAWRLIETVLTDADPAFFTVLASLLPWAKHLLCMWHAFKNFVAKVGGGHKVEATKLFKRMLF